MNCEKQLTIAGHFPTLVLAVSWINAPVHFCPDRSEKFLVLQIDQNEMKWRGVDPHFFTPIEDKHA